MNTRVVKCVFIALMIIGICAACQDLQATQDEDQRRTQIAQGIFGTQTRQALIPFNEDGPTADRMPSKTPMPTLTPTPTAPNPALLNTAIPSRSAPISMDTRKQISHFATWGKGPASNAIFSPDGSSVAVASQLGVYVYQMPDMNLIQVLSTTSNVKDVVFSSDGNVIAAALEQGLIQLFHVPDGAVLGQFDVHSKWDYPINSLACSPDGELLAVGVGSQIKLLDWDTGVEETCLEIDEYDIVEYVAFSRNGSLLAAGTYNGEVRVWDRQTYTLIQSMGHADPVTDLSFSLDGQFLASCGADLRVWDVQSGRLESMHASEACALDFSHDGQTLAIGISGIASLDSSDVSATIVQLSSTDWSVISEQDVGGGSFQTLTFAPDDTAIVSLIEDAAIMSEKDQIVSLFMGQSLHSWVGYGYEVVSIDFSRDDNRLLIGYGDGSIWQWSALDGQIHFKIPPLKDDVDRLLRGAGRAGLDRAFFSEDEQQINIMYRAGIIGLVDLMQRENVLSSWEDRSPYRVTLSPDGRIVAACETNNISWTIGSLSLWHREGGDPYLTLSEEMIASLLAFSPDGALLVAFESDNYGMYNDLDLKVFNVESGDVEWETVLEQNLETMGISQDGSMLAAGTSNAKLVYVWEMSDGRLLLSLDAGSGQDESSSAMPDYWGLDSGEGISCVAFSPDGELLAVGTSDGQIQLWNVGSGELVQNFEYPPAFPSQTSILDSYPTGISSLAFSSDGSLLAVGDTEGIVTLWGIP